MPVQPDGDVSKLFVDPFWLTRPNSTRDEFTPNLDTGDERMGEVTLWPGVIRGRTRANGEADIGWTRIGEVRIRPIIDKGKDAGMIDGDGDVAPVLDQAIRRARHTLRVFEATRRVVVDLHEGINQDQLAVIRDPNDDLRPSEIREITAKVFLLAKEHGRKDPVKWVQAVMGCSPRQAQRHVTDAETHGLIPTEARRTTNRKTTKKSRGKK